MKVLITGGAGFIGSHIADRLLARGDEVLVIDNYSTGRRDNLTKQQGLTVVEGTIADAELIEKHFAAFKPNVVVHAAASYKDPGNWIEDSRTNTLGGAIIAQASKRHEVGRLLYFQTALCYGLHPDEQPITLDHEIRPKDSSYAISKTAAEHYIALSGVEFLSFRLANAYGPRNLSGPPPTFFQRLSAGKKCFVMDTRRDFIYVQDLVDVVEKAIDGKGEQGYYHISSGGDFSIQELFDAVIKAMEIKLDEPVEVRPRGKDDAFTILLDPSKTEKLFDWKITTSLEDGIAAAVAYYQEFGVEETFTHLHMPDEEKA
jgi:UDP-glucose 4-epimerase